MSILPHILVTTAGARVLGIEGNDLILAYIFGAALDLDHLIKIPLYRKKFKNKTYQVSEGRPKLIQKVEKKEHAYEVLGMGIKRYYTWRTPLQEPIALLWIIPLSLYLGSAIPVVFFLLHLFLDYLADYPKAPLFPFWGYSTTGPLTGSRIGLKEMAVNLISLCVIFLI
ncbi:MAG: hypothetical protein Q8R20_03300 [Nanoarchaeota archaeon]|nr:hypothetical protein [Nanoarchaeota archaeon]